MGTVPDRRLVLGAGPAAGGGRGWVLSDPEQAVLVLGPPRSGKTTGVVVPNISGAGGPVVSTSTKPDVMRLTAAARQARGRCWHYDPTGETVAPPGVTPLRWSAVMGAADWDTAVRTTATMVKVTRRRGLAEQSHWDERAEALLAPLLHAAALRGEPMRTLVSWTNRREAEPALTALESAGSRLALDNLVGTLASEDRELSSIWSTAEGVLSAYRTEAALSTTDDVNFDPRMFVRSSDTVYVCAPGREQALVAPLVAGLVDRIVRDRYRLAAGWAGTPPPALVLALDEVANIAPLPSLPAIVSEGGGQGVLTLACFQDLTQAEARWPAEWKGFLTTFGAKVVLPGVAEPTTLEALSALVGEHDVRVRSTSRTGRGAETASWSVRRQRITPVDAIRRMPRGSALLIESNKGAAWIEMARHRDPPGLYR